ncbi:hypothetical protein FRB93_006549 [Tulasnella sp. JGI-2019a]|nr:hypothetical protein FRB93_006549 [Tulasnella sp. JGI-2019a]
MFLCRSLTFGRRAVLALPSPSVSHVSRIHSSAASHNESSNPLESTPSGSSSVKPNLPPTDWGLYRNLFSTSPNSPLTHYNAIRELGYDGAFEIFLKYHPNQDHWKLAKRVLGKSPTHSPEMRVKLAMRNREDIYLAHMMDRLGRLEDGEVEDGRFAGGSFEDWKLWFEGLLSSDHKALRDLIGGFKIKLSSRDPAKPDWGMHTLLPPTDEEPEYRYWTITRRNEKHLQAILARVIRLSSISPTHGKLHVNLPLSSWPVGVTVVFCIWFDKAQNVLRFTDKEGKDVVSPMTVKDMVSAGDMGALLDLGVMQGLIDPEEVRVCEASWALQFDCDTLNLRTNLARGGVIRTYADLNKMTTRRRWNWTLKDPKLCRKPIGPEVEPVPMLDTTAAGTSNVGGDSRSSSKEGDQESGVKKKAPEVEVRRKTLQPSDGDRSIRMSVTIADDALLRRKAKSVVPEAWIEEVNVIPYITRYGSVMDPESPLQTEGTKDPKTTSYFIDTVTPLAYPPTSGAPHGALDSKMYTQSQSPQSLRFFLPHAHLRRDLIVMAKGHARRSKVGVAFTGEEVRSRWPIIFEWARARGYWQEIDVPEDEGQEGSEFGV